jgi:nucleoid-associated protein YgaU
LPTSPAASPPQPEQIAPATPQASESSTQSAPDAKAPTPDTQPDKKAEEPKQPIKKAPAQSADDPKEIADLLSAPIRVTRVAKPGEYLSRMIAEVYGASSDKLIKIVRQRNPQIGDPDLILVGQTVIFPEIPSSEPPH